MKPIRFTNAVILGLALAIGAGCRKGPALTTHIPGQPLTGPNVSDSDRTAGLADRTNPDSLNSGIPSNDPSSHAGWAEDSTVFKANTVHFAFDSSVVRPDDQANVAAVASHLKSDTAAAVRVEGHCDERGTAEYNRSLGERRAQAVRTELVGLGIAATRVDTITYGFERPADPGHDETAWRKNRRGEFILLTPPGK